MKPVDHASSIGTERKKAVWGCGAALIVVSALTACEQAPRSMLGPTATVSAGRYADSAPENRWGSLGQGVMHSAANESGFVCVLGPYGPAENSHATISNSGNETVVCTGQAPVAPDKTEHLEGFPCLLHFGDGDPTTLEDITFDSRAVVTPSGHVTLVCKS